LNSCTWCAGRRAGAPCEHEERVRDDRPAIEAFTSPASRRAGRDRDTSSVRFRAGMSRPPTASPVRRRPLVAWLNRVASARSRAPTAEQRRERRVQALDDEDDGNDASNQRIRSAAAREGLHSLGSLLQPILAGPRLLQPGCARVRTRLSSAMSDPVPPTDPRAALSNPAALLPFLRPHVGTLLLHSAAARGVRRCSRCRGAALPIDEGMRRAARDHQPVFIASSRRRRVRGVRGPALLPRDLLGERVVATCASRLPARDPHGPAFSSHAHCEVLSRLTADTTLVQSIAGVNLSITLRSIISWRAASSCSR